MTTSISCHNKRTFKTRVILVNFFVLKEVAVEFMDLMRRASEIRALYAEFEEVKYGRSWTDEELALGFVSDVGDLAKLVQAMNGIRDTPDTKEKLGHGLADCLWSVIVLAQAYEVDLEAAFLKTMDELEAQLTE